MLNLFCCQIKLTNVFSLLLVSGVFFPLVSSAECSPNGSTVVFVNGIFKTQDEAKINTRALEEKFDRYIPNHGISFLTAYNPTHLAGGGDLVQSVFQLFGSSVSQHDLNTILMQIHPEVGTRKLLLVGHSQGAFYTNAMYDYLLAHGEPKQALHVYNVGTPAAFTAGGGTYLTAKQDLLVQLVADAARKARAPLPLPPNADIDPPPENFKSTFPGHSFVGAYLASAPNRVVSDITQALAQLEPMYSSDTGDCFTPPEQTLAYRAGQVVFGVADPAADAARTGAVLAYRGGVVVVRTAGAWAQAGYAAARSALGLPAKDSPRSVDDTVKDFTVVKSLYGSSLESDDARELVDPRANQGAAVATALRGRVAGAQTQQTDDAPLPIRYVQRGSAETEAEDVVEPEPQEPTSTPLPPVATTTPGLFTASTTPPSVYIVECAYSLRKDFCMVPTDTVQVVWDALPAAAHYRVLGGKAEVVATLNTAAVALPDASSTLQVVAYDVAGATATSAPQAVFVATHPLAISEVAWAGTDASSNDQWIELQNRTPYWLDLSHVAWMVGSSSLPLKEVGDFYATFAETTGRSVEFGPLYTFVRTDGVFRNSRVYDNTSYTPVVPFGPLPTTGEHLQLVWRTASSTFVLDETPSVAVCGGWCAGALASTTRYRGGGITLQSNLSMERKDAELPGADADNWVSNDGYYLHDGYLKDRAGKPALGTAFAQNSIQAPSAGFSCADHPHMVRPGDHVVSNFFDCTYYSGFMDPSLSRVAQLYAGTEGDSTLLYHFDLRDYIQTGRTRRAAHVFVATGTPMYLAIVPGTLVQQFGIYLTQGIKDGLLPPSDLYRIVPFVWGP